MAWNGTVNSTNRWTRLITWFGELKQSIFAKTAKQAIWNYARFNRVASCIHMKRTKENQKWWSNENWRLTKCVYICLQTATATAVNMKPKQKHGYALCLSITSMKHAHDALIFTFTISFEWSSIKINSKWNHIAIKICLTEKFLAKTDEIWNLKRKLRDIFLHYSGWLSSTINRSICMGKFNGGIIFPLLTRIPLFPGSTIDRFYCIVKYMYCHRCHHTKI